jgi:hypothetical protein
MEKRQNQSSRKVMNIFLILFLAIGALLAGSVTLLYQVELNTFLNEIKKEEQHTIDQQRTAISGEFDSIVSDLLFLSRQNELHSYLEQGGSMALKAMQAEYKSMSAAKRIYDQIRYLNAEGMEMVRVNLNAGESEAVSEEKLQNKSKRYYFTDTFKLE